MSENTDKRTATQKIEDLEKVVTVLYQAVSQNKNALEALLRSQSDMALVKDALKLLNKKTEAIIQNAAPETGITVASVSATVVKMNVDDLTAQVAGYVANGHLVAADEVADNSYLVAEELNADGTLANPRIQFRLDSQDPATVEALKGKKVRDVISFGENKFSAKLLEIYSLVEPKAEDAVTEAKSAPAADAGDAQAETAYVAQAEDAPAAESQVADPQALPVESPVEVFVPSGEMLTASGS
jgi:hypothetical protein